MEPRLRFLRIVLAIGIRKEELRYETATIFSRQRGYPY